MPCPPTKIGDGSVRSASTTSPRRSRAQRRRSNRQARFSRSVALRGPSPSLWASQSTMVALGVIRTVMYPRDLTGAPRHGPAQAPTSGVARHPRSGPRVSRLNRASGGATSESGPFEAKAQAARRLRLTPDALDERERRLAAEGDCLRFRRNFTGAAAGGDCGGATGDHSACSIAGAGGVVTTPRGSRRLFTLPRPKASLNIAPYQSTTAPATVVGAVARGNGVAEASGEGVTSAGSLVARSSRDDSRCFGDLMTSTPMTHSRSTRDRHFVLVT
jgi:hypothetical protein